MFNYLKRRKNLKQTGNTRGAPVFPLHAQSKGIDFLVEFINHIRPKHHKKIANAELNFKAALYQVSQDKSLLFSLRKSLLTQFQHTNLLPAITENGITSSRGFIQDVLGKLKHRILPVLQKPDNFLYVINKVFYKKTDWYWVEKIDDGLWKQFFELLGIQVNLTEPALIKQFTQSLQILSYRVASLGLEKEITHRFENINDASFPFIEQNRLVNEWVALQSKDLAMPNRELLLENITEALHNCNQSIQWVREQSRVYGTSLAQTYILTRLTQQVERMFIIIDVLNQDNVFNTERFTEYFKTVIYNENRKNSIWETFSINTGYLAYQIAEHGGRTGEKYIANTRSEFWRMFRSACGGGIIISFIAIIKNMIGKLQVAPFWQGFLYSTNYSLGFILIQDTNSTLATKQPAFTANHVASSFDAQKIGGHPDIRNLAITVAKVSRTQIASFAGNLLLVFPLSYFFAFLFKLLTGSAITADYAAAHSLLTSQQPFHSPALLYAAFTGFFLFASGIIAGYVENHVVYGRIPERIRNLSSFKNSFNEKWQHKILRYVETRLGGLAGNIALGFFLGMAAFIGYTFGLPFDIRHITISAANTSIGLFGMNNQIAISELAYTVFGVLLIGFINFAVSFILAFIVAVKSRGIHLRDYPEFLGILWRYFKKHPSDFIKTPLKGRVAEELH